MKEKIIYYGDNEFSKMNQKQKLSIPESYIDIGSRVEIRKAVLIPTRRKMDGYGVGAFFVETEQGWCRLMDYDCWRVVTDITNPVPVNYGLVRGDFEYGGICIFGFAGESNGKHTKVFAEYGGEIVIEKK